MSIGFDYGTVAENRTEVRQSPFYWIPGVDSAITIQVDGTGTIDNLSMTLYENGNDVSSTKLSGSVTATGRNITTKTFTSLVGGSTYKYYVTFTDDNVQTVREGTILCLKLGVNPSRYPALVNRFRIYNSPIVVYPNQTWSATVVVMGQGTLASPTMSLYKGTSDASSLLSGTMSASGRTITTKTVNGLTSGEYMGYLFFTDDGLSTVRYFELIVPKLGV